MRNLQVPLNQKPRVFAQIHPKGERRMGLITQENDSKNFFYIYMRRKKGGGEQFVTEG